MRQHRIHAAVVGLAALAALAGPARAAESPRRIGIVVSTAVVVTPEEARALAVTLGEALTEELKVEVIAGEETERRLPATGLPEDCVAKPDCRSDIARRLDADELLFLVVIKVGKKIQIDPTWTDAATARVTSRAKVEIGEKDDPMQVFRKSAKALLPHIRVGKTGPDIVVITPGQGGTPRHMTKPAWIALGVSGAALVGGAVFGIQARSKYNDLEAMGCKIGEVTNPCPQSEIDSLRNKALIADVFFGVSAAAAITTLVFYLRSDSDAVEPSPVKVAPTAGGVTFEIGGRF
jgi:hypothetical protein